VVDGHRGKEPGEPLQQRGLPVLHPASRGRLLAQRSRRLFQTLPTWMLRSSREESQKHAIALDHSKKRSTGSIGEARLRAGWVVIAAGRAPPPPWWSVVGGRSADTGSERMRRWLWLNGLALAMFGAFLVFLTLQSIAGWKAENHELADFGRPPQRYGEYVTGGSFVEAVFENWESEFLQIGSYVLLTAWLVQRGSPESKPLEGDDDNPEDPRQVRADSPMPVRRGGLLLKLYETSLSTAILGLFALSFVLHLLGGTAAYNDEQALLGKPPVSAGQFLFSSEFWEQSMQNWQSEFLSVGVLIVFGIFLRQRGSSQSKPVAAPHAKTGD